MSRKFDRSQKLNAAVRATIDDPHFIVAMAKAMTKEKPAWMPRFVWKVLFNLVVDFPTRRPRRPEVPEIPSRSGS
jgi:hypothetical protein